MNAIKNNILVRCPACDATISFQKNPVIGARVTCRTCDALLEVISKSPVELDWAFEEPYDDDDDDYDDDDDDYDYDDDDDDYDYDDDDDDDDYDYDDDED